MSELSINFNVYGITAIASDIYYHYPSLAKDYLGIAVPFIKSVFEIDEFVSESENGFSPSLNKKFKYREFELNLIENNIHNDSLIVLSGKPGVGKTMLAVEYAKRRKKKGEKWAIIKAFGKPNLEEIAESSFQYDFFVIDDLYSFGDSAASIIHLLKNKHVIVTSRKYLVEPIKRSIGTLDVKLQVVEIPTLTDQNIAEIVKSNTEISNTECLRKIAEVAKGNPRIAFMAAEEAIKDGPASLYNVKNIFANYYCERIETIEDQKNKSDKTLEIIGLICLLQKLSLNSLKEDDAIFDLIGISKAGFIDSIEFLNKNDIVSLTYNDIVAVSDQCLADYLAYYVFLEKRLLKFSSIIDIFFKNHADNIVGMINMLDNMFYSKEDMEYIGSEVSKSWDALKAEGDEKSLKIYCAKFALMNRENSLLLLWERAEEKEDEYFGVTNGNIDWRISAISALLDDETRSCCQIIEKMIVSESIDLRKITEMLVRHHGITMAASKSKYKTQRDILSYFLEGEKKYSLNFLREYCTSMLKFLLITYPKGNGRNLTFFGVQLRDGDADLTLLRKDCFDIIFKCDGVYDSLDEYFSDFPQGESINIFKTDLANIEAKLKERDDRDEVRELIVYLDSKVILDHYGLRWDFMETQLQRPLSLLSPILSEQAIGNGESFEEYEKKRKEVLYKNVRKASFEENIERLELFDKILAHSSMLDTEIIDFAEAFFSGFRGEEIFTHLDCFLDFCSITAKLENYDRLIVDELIKEVGIASTYSRMISSKNEDFKGKAIVWFFKKASEAEWETSILLFDSYLKNIQVAMPSGLYAADFLQAKIPFEKIYLFLKQYFTISESWTNGDYENLIYMMEEKGFFDYLLSTDAPLIKKMYLLCLKNGRLHFDYEGNYLRAIVDNDESFATKVAGAFFKHEISTANVQIMKSVWKCKNYVSIGNAMFNSIRASMNSSLFFDEIIMFGFGSLDRNKELSSEQLTWLLSYLNTHQDEGSIKQLNTLVRELGFETRKCYAKCLVDICPSVALLDDFLQPPSLISYSGSYTQIIKSRISFYESIMSTMPDDISYIEYKKLLRGKIGEAKSQIVPILKAEMMGDVD